MTKQTNWWRGGVIYQIYPRSFQDSTGDGNGDLAGITARLDYIASLGVDAIWISPFFQSPMEDNGYDVSDYCAINPMFGTMADFDTLLKTAHKHGLKVMIDLVLSHTSHEHDWFQTSRQSRDNPKSDWYVWADAADDGTPPNNWLSIFGGAAWQWDTRRCQYYLHNFLTSQPDLNFHTPAVQDALLEVADFWLAKGVDGFRLDTINFYFHDAELRDNPPLPPFERNDTIAPRVNPYNHQDHVYDRNRPENIAFLERLRACMDKYDDRCALGEVGDAVKGLDIIAEYTGDGRVHTCYAFDFLSPESLTCGRIRSVLSELADKAPNGWATWALSNHDVARHASRLADAGDSHAAHVRMLAGVLLSLPGSVCLYQGEELGLCESSVPFEDLQDAYGKEFWPEYKGRDGARTPMVWAGNALHAGFSSAARCWLPVDAGHIGCAVDKQGAGSVLAVYRELIGARQAFGALRSGRLEWVDLGCADVLAFWRADGNARVLCVFHIGKGEVAVELAGELAGDFDVIYQHNAVVCGDEGVLRFKDYGFLWMNGV